MPQPASVQTDQDQDDEMPQPVTSAYHDDEDSKWITNPPEEYQNVVNIIKDPVLRQKVVVSIFLDLYQNGHGKSKYPSSDLIPAGDCLHLVNYITYDRVE